MSSHRIWVKRITHASYLRSFLGFPFGQRRKSVNREQTDSPDDFPPKLCVPPGPDLCYRSLLHEVAFIKAMG